MTGYVSSALFVYTQESEHLLQHMQSNSFGTRITAIDFEAFEQDPDALPEGVGHVVVAGSLDVIKVVIGRAMKSGFSLGIVPLQSQKNLKQVRFLVNEKYLIVRNVQSIRKKEKLIVSMDILARERLTRSDMDLFQKKIQENYPRQVIIRANIVYIL